MKKVFFCVICLSISFLMGQESISQEMLQAIQEYREYGLSFKDGALKYDASNKSLKFLLINTYKKWIEKYKNRQKRLELYCQHLGKTLEDQNVDYELQVAQSVGDRAIYYPKLQSDRDIYDDLKNILSEFADELKICEEEYQKITLKSDDSEITVEKRALQNVFNDKKICSVFFIKWELIQDVPIIFSSTCFLVFPPSENEYGRVHFLLEEGKEQIFIPQYVKYNGQIFEIFDFEYQAFSFGMSKVVSQIKIVESQERKK